MNKNKKAMILLQKSLAAASVTSLVLGSAASVAVAGSVDTGSVDTDSVDATADQETPGALAGVMAATAQIHENIIDAQEQRLAEFAAPIELSPLAQVESTDWSDKLMANVRTYLNIRSGPGTNNAIVGRMLDCDVASVLGSRDGWYEVKSGDVKGFVSAKYSVVGDEAKQQALTIVKTFAVTNVDSVKVRSEASEESTAIGTLRKNFVLEVDSKAEGTEGWVSVKYAGKTGFIREDLVSVEQGELGTAMTPDEIATADPSTLVSKRASLDIITPDVTGPNTIYNPGYDATAEEEILLAALLMCEAGSTYEGMLAVGGVVMNRLRSGYSDSIRGVIFQSGQFTPAGSGAVDKKISAGVSELSLQAARDAISGIDITGGCKSFRAASSGHSGVNIGGNVFF